jgi:hypothetical protein
MITTTCQTQIIQLTSFFPTTLKFLVFQWCSLHWHHVWCNLHHLGEIYTTLSNGSEPGMKYNSITLLQELPGSLEIDHKSVCQPVS